MCVCAYKYSIFIFSRYFLYRILYTTLFYFIFLQFYFFMQEITTHCYSGARDTSSILSLSHTHTQTTTKTTPTIHDIARTILASLRIDNDFYKLEACLARRRKKSKIVLISIRLEERCSPLKKALPSSFFRIVKYNTNNLYTYYSTEDNQSSAVLLFFFFK